jgi:hypothetical protein
MNETIQMINPLLNNPFVLLSSIFVTIFLLVLTYILFKSLRKINVADLFVERSTNKISHTKFWSNIAYFASTIAFLSLNLFSNQATSGGMEIIWLIYLGVVASNAVASKWISYKYSGNTTTNKDDEQQYNKTRYHEHSSRNDEYRDIDSPD